MRDRKVLLVVAALSSGILFSGQYALSADPQSSPPTITPVVTGLNNPRGVAVDEKGGLYVAEAGRYLGTGPDPQRGVTTGAVSKWVRGANGGDKAATWQRVWSTPFTGLYTNENGLPEVIGASGVSVAGAGCTKNSPGRRNGCALATIVGESQRGFETENPDAPVPPGLGRLFRMNPGSGTAAVASDVGDQQYQWTDDHAFLFPDDFPDSNPYGLLVARRHGGRGVMWRVFVADAGANTVSEIGVDGSTRVIAYIPNDGVRDSTPTCVAQGPDGALYVGTLNLVKNGFGQDPGHSDVWRIDPDTSEDYLGAAQLWATGLTTVTSCTFDQEGNFWATEMFQPSEGGPPGDIVRIPFANPVALDRFGGGQLPFPGGIAAGPKHGTVYVSINSVTFTPDSGAVVEVTLD